MPLRGNTESFNLSDLIQVLSNNQFSGTLKVTNQDTTKVIFFQKGELQLLSWPQNKSIRLGSILLKQKKITEEQLEEVLALQKESPKKLGELLIDKGYLSEEEIHKAVKAKLEEEIYEIFTWENAYFEFLRNQYPPEFKEQRAVTTLGFNPHNLLMEGMRRSDEWKLLRQRIPSDQVIFKHLGPVPESFSEDEKIQEMHSLIDGTTKIDQLVARSRQGKFEVYSTLNLLLQNGVIAPLSFSECQQAFSAALNEGNLLQSIIFLEAAFGISEEFSEVHARLFNSLLSHREFIAHPDEFKLSLHIEKEMLSLLIKSLFLKKHWGTLLVSTENRKKYLQISEKAIHVYDTSPQDYLKLGQVLVRHGKILRSQVDYCVTQSKLERAQVPLGAILEREGFISAKDLEDALREKILEDVAEVLLWDGTYVSFRKNNFNPPRVEKVSQYSCPMDGELHRQIVENITRWEDLLKRVSHLQTIFTSAQSPNSQTMDWESVQVVDLINGQRSVQDLIQMVNLTQMSLCQVLYRLLNKGHIRNFTPAELDGKIEETLALKNPHLAIKYCNSAYEQTRDSRYIDKRAQIQQKDNILVANRQEYKLEGDFFTFPIRDLFQVFSQNLQSGTISLWSGDKARNLFFHNGNISAIYLKNDPEEIKDSLRLSHEEVEYYLPEEDEVVNDILEIFHWKTARFRYLSNFFPEYYYSQEGQNHLWQFDTQLLMMESIKQLEGFEFLCNSIPSLHVIVGPQNGASSEDDHTKQILDMSRQYPTVLDIYSTLDGRDISQFVLKMEDLIDEGMLKVMDLSEARRRIDQEDYENLEEALKLCHHIETFEPSAEIQATILTFMEYFAEEETLQETLGERKLQRKELALLVEQIVAQDSSGTLILLSPQGRYTIYLSKQELWLFSLDQVPDLKSAISQVTGQREPSLKEALYYADKKGISLSQALLEARVFTPQEVDKVIENKITTALLELFSLSEAKIAYHPSFFPLDARNNLKNCLTMTGKFEVLLRTLLPVLLNPLLEKIPLVDGIIFEYSEKGFRITERTRVPEKSRKKSVKPKVSFVGETDLRKLVDGKNSVGEITGKTRLPKITVWKLLVNLLRLGEISLMSSEKARKQGQNAYMGNNFEQAQIYYEYALLLDPTDEKLQRELERIQRFAGKAGR